VSTPSAPPPAVPYGPGPSDPDPVPASTPVTAEGVARSAGSTALKWGFRILLPLLLRALFRAISRR